MVAYATAAHEVDQVDDERSAAMEAMQCKVMQKSKRGEAWAVNGTRQRARGFDIGEGGPKLFLKVDMVAIIVVVIEVGIVFVFVMVVALNAVKVLDAWDLYLEAVRQDPKLRLNTSQIESVKTKLESIQYSQVLLSHSGCAMLLTVKRNRIVVEQ